MKIRIPRRVGPDTVIAFAASVVAVCSLVLTILTAQQQQKHERLSLQPYIVSSLGADAERGWIAVANNGLGPAHIRTFEVFVDGQPQQSWEALVGKIAPDIPNVYVKFSVPTGHLWPKEQIKDVFETTHGALIDRLRTHNSISVRICYCSLYEECWLSQDGSVGSVKACSSDTSTSVGMNPSFSVPQNAAR
jgi:hypothetical protein